MLGRLVLARAADAATARQREAARKLIESGQPLAVSKTVLLELEWILRGYYKFSVKDVGRVYTHLLAQPHVQIEDRLVVERAVRNHAAGLDFADALHHASYAAYKAMASFDDRRFARRAKRLNLAPRVTVPK